MTTQEVKDRAISKNTRGYISEAVRQWSAANAQTPGSFEMQTLVDIIEDLTKET